MEDTTITENNTKSIRRFLLDTACHLLPITDIKRLIATAKTRHMDSIQPHRSDNQDVSFQSDYLGNITSDTV